MQIPSTGASAFTEVPESRPADVVSGRFFISLFAAGHIQEKLYISKNK